MCEYELEYYKKKGEPYYAYSFRKQDGGRAWAATNDEKYIPTLIRDYEKTVTKEFFGNMPRWVNPRKNK